MFHSIKVTNRRLHIRFVILRLKRSITELAIIISLIFTETTEHAFQCSIRKNPFSFSMAPYFIKEDFKDKSDHILTFSES